LTAQNICANIVRAYTLTITLFKIDVAYVTIFLQLFFHKKIVVLWLIIKHMPVQRKSSTALQKGNQQPYLITFRYKILLFGLLSITFLAILIGSNDLAIQIITGYAFMMLWSISVLR